MNGDHATDADAGALDERLNAGLDRMRDRAWCIGPMGPFPAVPDDELEDALRQKLSLPDRTA